MKEIRDFIRGNADGDLLKGVEKGLENPSFTPAVVASLEATEVCKVLLGCGSPLRRRTLTVDLLEMEFVEVE